MHTDTSAQTELGRGAKSGLPLPVGTLVGLFLAVAAVLLVGFFSYSALQSRSNSAELVTHTFNVIARLESVLSVLKDVETGQRGYLLTGTDAYLEPYTNARIALPGEIAGVHDLTRDNPEQQRKIDRLQAVVDEKMALTRRGIELWRAGNTKDAVALADDGKLAMDRVRALIAEMQSVERQLLASRQVDWDRAVVYSNLVVWGGSALLLALIAAGAVVASRDYRAREKQVWLRAGQMGLSARMLGDQRLDSLGENVVGFLTEYLEAQVSNIYIADGGGRFRRFAGYAGPAEAASTLSPGDGLLGQVAKDGRALHVREVPEGYLPVSSSLGRGRPRELLLAPVVHAGTVHAVVEFGFFRAVHPADREFLELVSESIGIAVRSSKDRTRLEELLEETQRQSEELQTQQEELRVSNEELAEQGRVLKESQARLEAQQAELEQTNAQLEEQAQLLETQKEELSGAQIILQDKASELERSNQYKSEFLANMSHELRTPLNSTLILAKLLADNKDGNLNAEQVKFAQTISGAGNDLLALINDILDLSKIEAGKVEIRPEAVHLVRTLDTLQKSLQPLTQEKGLRFSVSVDAEVPERIQTDVQRLGQILKNLLSNALKFTQLGEVSLHVSSGSGRTVSFSVRDTGIGIPSAQHEVIFEAFRQADGSTHRKFGGTGLGLSISRDLARLLGGDITVDSAPGDGSTFTLTLPVNYQSPAETEARVSNRAAITPATRRRSATPVAPGATEVRSPPPLPLIEDDRERLKPGSRVILVVEDDARFAVILRDLAHEMDFQCIVAHSADAGLAAAGLYVPNAILLDMNLPDHSGMGVLDQLKRNPTTRHIPVHVVSVADYSQEALELGAIGYALKPVKREELVVAFEKLAAKFSQGLRTVLVVEDDERQRESIGQLLGNEEVRIVAVGTAGEALKQLQAATFDCMVIDLNLPDLSGYELLERMAEAEDVSFPPVIVYTGRSLTRDEEQRLRRYSKSIIIKDARSPERLLDEVTLFLHQVEARLPADHQRMLKDARHRETALSGKRVLVVEDDVRNIYALTSLLEPKGVRIEIARNGKEALQALEGGTDSAAGGIALVLMDIMMPEMDGFTAMREIRKRPQWRKLPIIALTAKAMKDDNEKCLAAGANDYIAKPLDVERLLSLVRVWMPR